MQQVGDVLTFALKTKGLKKRYTIESVIYYWQKIVGPELSRQTKAYKIQNGVLVIIVTNSVWCHHLSMMKNELITKINTFAQENLVKDIRFLAGVLQNSQNSEQDIENQVNNITQKIQNMHLAPEEVRSAKSMVAEVRDENLRKKLLWILEKEKLLKKAKAEEKWHPCTVCGILCPPDDQYCVNCERELKQNHILSIRKFLLDAPWMGYEETSQYITCTRREFYQAKNGLMEFLDRMVYRGHADTLQVNTLVMLMSGRKPGQFDTEFVEHTLRKIRRKKYVPAFRS